MAESGDDPESAPLLYPVAGAEAGAIEALANYRVRLGSAINVSQGYHEANAKKDGLIRWESLVPSSLDEVVLQGPHFGIATPFSKQPNIPCRNNRDCTAWDLTALPSEAVPATNYQRATDLETFQAAQDNWAGRRYAEYFRLAWRRMIPFDSERSLFVALIPPGPAHVDAICSSASSSVRTTALNAGFWAGLPLDYLLRITGRSDLRNTEAQRMPAPTPGHPLETALLLRTLRLNCLTNAYTPLWAELYDSTWREEAWAVDWPNLAPLGAVTPEWEYGTPLRTERERRSALVELDALVSVWLGITADQLVAG